MIKFFRYVLLALVIFPQLVLSDVDTEQEDKNVVVAKFLDAIKTKDPVEISKFVEYPFSRPNPVPDIKNEEDFVKNYELVLDDDMMDFLAKTEPKEWVNVGWRGIMLPPGFFWLNYDGKLIAVNSYTEKELEYVVKWEENDRKNLYPELTNYAENLYVFEIDGATGRIDVAQNGEHKNYRLSFWNEGKTMADKPDILISDGEIQFYGSANNHDYSFKKGDYVYRFIVTYVGPMDYPPYMFEIFRNGEIVSEDEVKIIK